MPSPYSKPDYPHDPTGIVHYVVNSERQTVNLLYAAWVAFWKDVYRNNTPYPAPFDYNDLYT